MYPRIYSLLFSLLLFCSFMDVLPLAGQDVLPVRDHKEERDGMMKTPSFRRNAGQWSEQILFNAIAGSATARFLKEGVSFAYTRGLVEQIRTDAPSIEDALPIEDHGERLIWNVIFEGAEGDAVVLAENERPGIASYLIGSDPEHHYANVPESERIRYRDLYPKIDLIYATADGSLKYDYIVRPGGDVGEIRMRCEGIEGLKVNDRGELEIATIWGTIGEARPVAWQEIEGVRRTVDVRYRIINDTTFGFSIHAGYRPGYQLVIDPVILGWSTFVGGSGDADGYMLDMGRDAAGNVYGAGYYNGDFPVTPGVYDGTYAGNLDIFVFKLDATGSRLLYGTYIGGSQRDSAMQIIVLPQGEAIVCGTTFSQDFPKVNAYDGNYNANGDFVLFKLNAAGSALEFATFIGGNGGELSPGIAVDDSGMMYLAGSSWSPELATTASALDSTHNGASDVIIMKFSPDGGRLLYSSFLGGSSVDAAGGIAVDADGSIIVGGTTSSRDFQTTAGAFDRTGSTTADNGWLAKLAPDGRTLRYWTYLRGFVEAVAAGSNGGVIVAGDIPEAIEGSGFAPTGGAFDGSYNQNGDAFLMMMNASGSAPIFATYLGSSGLDHVTDLAVAPDGDIIVGGSVAYTESQLRSPGFRPNFPLTRSAIDSTHTYSGSGRSFSGYEGFVSRFSSDGGTLHFSTLLGGRYNDYHVSFIPSPSSCDQSLFMGMTSHSPDFPTTPGVYQRTKLNSNDDQPVILLLRPKIEPAFTPIIGECGQVTFIDSTSGRDIWRQGPWKPSTWRWDFGDGTTSTEQSPVHEYLKPGTYRVTLHVGEPCDSITKTIEVKSARGDAFVTLRVDRGHAAILGRDITIPILLLDNPDTLQATSIAVTFSYDTMMMEHYPFDADRLERMVEGTALEGWNLRVQSPSSGVLRITGTAPDGEILRGPDTLLLLDFMTFLRAGVTSIEDSVWRTELPLSATLDGRYCTRLETAPGQLILSICGLEYRLIEMSDFGNKLGEAQPNPFNPATEIPFSLAFDGPALLEIFDASGSRVAALLDDWIQAGRYVVRWDATDYASGVYYYRLSSGNWSETRRMVVVK